MSKIIAARAPAGDRNTYPGGRCPEDHSAAPRGAIDPRSRAAPIDFHHPARAGQYTHRSAPRQKIDTHPPRAAPVLEMPSGPTIDFSGPNAHG
jgi:hypothetical protein